MPSPPDSPPSPPSSPSSKGRRPRESRRKSRPAAPPPPARDMHPSCFASILSDVVARIPGAYAAVLVDFEGEAVDYTGHADPFDLKLAAAHWQIVLNECVRFTASSSLGQTRSLVVRGVRRSFIAHALPEGYAVLVLLHRRAGFSPVHRAFSICERALAHEARWELPAAAASLGTRWFAVDVTLGRTKRPIRVASTPAGQKPQKSQRPPAREPPHPKPPSNPLPPSLQPQSAASATAPSAIDIELLGTVKSGNMLPRELGYRARTHSGLEFTLVREPGGFWYADEDVTGA